MKVIIKKKKTTVSKKDSTQDTTNTAKYRPNDQQKSRKSVVVLCDSMTKKINTNCKSYVRTFSGATTTCMEDYMKTLSMSPYCFILHTGTNDFASSKSSKGQFNNLSSMSTKKRVT